MKFSPVTALWLLLCVSWPATRIAAQAGRLQHYAEGERARAAGLDSLAQVAYLKSIRNDSGAEIADSLTGRAYQEIATIYLNQYRDSLALPYFRRSLALRDSLFAGPHNERAHVRTNMAMSIYWLGMRDSALLLTQEANAMYEALEHPDSVNWLINLNELGLQAIQREDYGLAYSSSFRAVDLCAALPDLPAVTPFITYYRAARVLSNFGHSAKALELGRRALEVLPPGNEAYRAACMNLIALLERETGDYESSEAHLRQSLAIAAAEPEGTVAERADANLYLAEHYAMRGQGKQADRHERQARELYARAGSLAPLHQRNQLSHFDMLHGRYGAAAARLDAALHHLRRKEGADVSANLVQLARTLLLRARLYHLTEEPDKALSDLHAAFAIQDRLRSDFTDPASRRYLSQDMRADLDLGVALHYRAYLKDQDISQLWQAFWLSERARAFSLVADLGRNAPPQEALVLRQELARREREVAWGDSSQQTKVEALRIRLAGIERSRSVSGRLVPPLDSAALLAYLSREQTQLLEYHLADSLKLAFLLSPGGLLQAFSLPVTAKLTEQVTDWNDAIRASAFRRKSLRPRAEQARLDSLFLTLGSALSRQLLPQDVRDALRSDLALCVVPDGPLNYLSFAALPLGGPAAGVVDYRNLPYVASSWHLSYGYSGSYLAQLAALPDRKYGLDVLALAPGFGAAARVAPSRSATKGIPLPPLVYNQEEARTIGDLLPRSEVYCDSLATRERFLDQLGRSRILHLSTHGVVDPRHPELSFVAFHQRPGQLDQEQLLYFNDLARLPIDNDLTVLAACETSLGQLAQGEAPLSFATAFAAAGARSTLTTLWQVDDHATKELMVIFYRHLGRGSRRREALAAAQDSLRAADYFHPYYWAAPTLYGLTGDLPTQASPVNAGLWGPWSWFAALCLAIAALLSHYHRRT